MTVGRKRDGTKRVFETLAKGVDEEVRSCEDTVGVVEHLSAYNCQHTGATLIVIGFGPVGRGHRAPHFQWSLHLLACSSLLVRNNRYFI